MVQFRILPPLLPALLITFGLNAHSSTYVGEGFGKTADIARQNALVELSQNLYVEVQSEVSSIAKSNGSLTGESRSQVISSLPILGANITSRKTQDGYYSKAQLDSGNSKKIYQNELFRIQSELIKFLKKEKVAEESALKLQLLNDIQSNLIRFSKLNTVSVLLGNDAVRNPDISTQEIQQKIQFYSENITSIKALAQVISKDFNNFQALSIKILPVNSKSPTPFSRILKENLQAFGQSSSKQMIDLRITYEESNSSLKIYVNAINPNNNTNQKSRNYSLLESGYRNIAYKPTTLDFQTLLHEGLVIENTFRGFLNTDLGDNEIEATIGELMRVYVKLSQAGYFYIVNYSSDGKAYLLELNDATGKRKFIQYVNADDANKWISLGEFEISPPLGSESLHLISSKHDLINSLPAIYFNQSLELWEASQNPLNLIKKIRKTSNVMISEDTLTFTSLP